MKNKKASLSLSVNAIIILILAIVMLGLGLGFIASLLLSTIAVGLMGILLERVIFSPLKANEFASVVSAIGVAILLGGIVEAIMGGEVRGVQSPWEGVIQI